MIIVIDGPAGAGKSSVARAVAETLHYPYLNSGALYRAIAYYIIEHQIDPNDERAIELALPKIGLDLLPVRTGKPYTVCLNGQELSHELYASSVEAVVSGISRYTAVRAKVGLFQQHLGKAAHLVADGRDMGTKVFPHADLKIFMTASVEVRAQRRYEALADPSSTSLEALRCTIAARDYTDMHRAESPLQQAKDAVLIDTSELSLTEVVEEVLGLVETCKP